VGSGPFPHRVLGFRRLGLRLGFRLGLGFESGFGFADLGQPALATCQLLGKLVGAPPLAVLGVFFGVDLLCTREQLDHLLLEALLGLAHPLVAHRLGLGGVGFDLGAIDGDVPELDQSRRLAELEHLHEQRAERRQMLLAERRHAVVVRVLIARQHPKRHVLVGRPLDRTRGRLADAVRVHQERHHHRRVETGSASIVLGLVHGVDGAQVQRRHHVQHEERQVALGKPFPHVRRQK
jgi:hypothetical protein